MIIPNITNKWLVASPNDRFVALGLPQRAAKKMIPADSHPLANGHVFKKVALLLCYLVVGDNIVWVCLKIVYPIVPNG